MCIRKFSVNNPVHLAKLFHQVLFIVKSSRSIAQKHIHMSGLRRIHRIVNDAGRIGSFFSSDDIYPGASSPFRQLFSRCCTECIRSGNQNFFALILQFARQLAHRGGLSHTVDADDKNDRLFLFKFIGSLPYLHLLPDALNQQLFTFCRIFYVFFLHLCFQAFNDFCSRVDSDIAHDKDFFQFLIKILVDGRVAVKNRINTMYNIIAGLCKSCL